jgi:hypothetical protein
MDASLGGQEKQCISLLLKKSVSICVYLRIDRFYSCMTRGSCRSGAWGSADFADCIAHSVLAFDAAHSRGRRFSL